MLTDELKQDIYPAATLLIYILLIPSMNSMSQTPKYKISPPDFGKHHFSKKEVTQLSENFELKNRNDLKYDSTDPSDYYELPDGRILLVLGFGNGSGTMYDSENEYKNIMSSSKGNLLVKEGNSR